MKNETKLQAETANNAKANVSGRLVFFALLGILTAFAYAIFAIWLVIIFSEWCFSVEGSPMPIFIGYFAGILLLVIPYAIKGDTKFSWKEAMSKIKKPTLR